MRRFVALRSSVSTIILAYVLGSVPAYADVLKIVINDAIHPITDEYVGRAIAAAGI